MNQSILSEIYQLLYQKFGPQGWWPICDKQTGISVYRKNFFGKLSSTETFEIAIGAILTQNTTWKNAEKAIFSLKKNSILTPKSILSSPKKTLYKLIRSSGYYKQKTKKIIEFCLWIQKNGGDLKRILGIKKGEILRNELLQINGIGRETADSILLYAGYLPFFVIDAYTRRLYSRVFLDPTVYKYDELQNIFEKNIDKNFKTYMEFHALIVKLSKEYCFKFEPACEKCIISKYCKKGILYDKNKRKDRKLS
ncbi:MAG: hypothetical protein K6357_04365 [Elusimicrobiota bacterium]